MQTLGFPWTLSVRSSYGTQFHVYMLHMCFLKLLVTNYSGREGLQYYRKKKKTQIANGLLLISNNRQGLWVLQLAFIFR